jgi:hypothetical protein
MFQQISKYLAMAASALVLVACGGGGGGGGSTNPSPENLGANAALQKYVGTWDYCETQGPNGTGSGSIKYSEKFASPTSAGSTYNVVYTVYSSADCTGAAIATVNQGGDMTVIASGTKSATVTTKAPFTSTTADKFVITVRAGTNTFTATNPANVSINNATNKIVVNGGPGINVTFTYVETAQSLKQIAALNNGLLYFGYDTGGVNDKDAEGFYNFLDNVGSTKRP